MVIETPEITTPTPRGPDDLPGVIIGSPEYTFSAMFAEGVAVISY